MKQTSFKKRARVKFPVDTPGDAVNALKVRAGKLIKLIFKGLPCVICLVSGDDNCRTVPHHILNKGMYNHLRFAMMNLIPMCTYHHRRTHNKQKEFVNWLLDNMPGHYRFYLNEKDKKSPVKTTPADIQDIIDDLQYYCDHPIEAENLIYEKSN